MNDLVKNKLAEAIRKYGTVIAEDDKKTKAILLDLLNNEYKGEINILVTAIEENIPSDLLSSNIPFQILIPQLIKKLTDNRRIDPKSSEWVVESWAIALNLNNNKGVSKLDRFYINDLNKLNKGYDLNSVINNETIIIIIGSSIVPELLDRPVAELLKTAIWGKNIIQNYFRRGIILNDLWWYKEQKFNLTNNQVISIGGAGSNSFSNEIIDDCNKNNYDYYKEQINNQNKIIKKNWKRIVLFGNDAEDTKRTVERFIEEDLSDCINSVWK